MSSEQVPAVGTETVPAQAHSAWAPAGAPAGHKPAGAGSSRRRWNIMIAVGIALALLAGEAVWGGLHATSARTHLYRAGALIQRWEAQIRAGDVTDAGATLTALRRQTGAARRDTTGPDWWLGTHLPRVGADISAVRTSAAVLDRVARQVLPGLTDLAGSLTLADLIPRDGAVDFAPLQHAAPTLAAIQQRTDRARLQVSAIATAGLSASVGRAVGQLTTGIDKLASLVATTARASTLLPVMFGAAGPRTYLLLAQNLAEARATGGIAGAYLVMRADHGRVSVVDQGAASSDLRAFDQPVLPLNSDQLGLYTSKLGSFPADINLSPYFPTTAALAREMYRLRRGVTVDGVLAVDPVALAYLLGATGAVTVPGAATLSAATAVRALLSDSYATNSPQRQDAYFAAAARAVFEALVRGIPRPSAALDALGRAAGERRLLVWSANADEEAALAGTVLGGALPEHDGGHPIVGVFLNDGSGAKLDYYLRGSAALGFDSCYPDGRVALRLRVTLTSVAPTSGLSASVTGLHLAGNPYTARTNVSIFSPAGGAVVDARLDGTPVSYGSGRERGRAVGLITVDVPPGGSRTIDVLVLTARPSNPPTRMSPALWVTPGVEPWELTVGSLRNCPIAR